LAREGGLAHRRRCGSLSDQAQRVELGLDALDDAMCIRRRVTVGVDAEEDRAVIGQRGHCDGMLGSQRRSPFSTGPSRIGFMRRAGHGCVGQADGGHPAGYRNAQLAAERPAGRRLGEVAVEGRADGRALTPRQRLLCAVLLEREPSQRLAQNADKPPSPPPTPDMRAARRSRAAPRGRDHHATRWQRERRSGGRAW